MTPQVVLTLDSEGLRSGFIPVTKVDDEGRRTGKMPLIEVSRLLKSVVRMELESRNVKLINRFSFGDLIAIGNNGPKWVAVKEIPPTEYVLTIVTGKAYKVKIPRLVARVSNMGSSYLFWTPDEVITAQTVVYPLIIGNIAENGWICIGTTRLSCEKPEGIDKFIRAAIEAPTTGTYLSDKTKVEEFYQGLSERWDSTIGAKFGKPLEHLLHEG